MLFGSRTTRKGTIVVASAFKNRTQSSPLSKFRLVSSSAIVTSDVIDHFRPTPPPNSVPRMAKFSEALGRWVCPVEFRRTFLDPKIGGSGVAADYDETDGEHDEVMKKCL